MSLKEVGRKTKTTLATIIEAGRTSLFTEFTTTLSSTVITTSCQWQLSNVFIVIPFLTSIWRVVGPPPGLLSSCFQFCRPLSAKPSPRLSSHFADLHYGGETFFFFHLYRSSYCCITISHIKAMVTSIVGSTYMATESATIRLCDGLL